MVLINCGRLLKRTEYTYDFLKLLLCESISSFRFAYTGSVYTPMSGALLMQVGALLVASRRPVVGTHWGCIYDIERDGSSTGRIPDTNWLGGTFTNLLYISVLRWKTC